VHGILGTTPEGLVDAVAAVDVAGDGLGRIVRPADRLRRPAPGPVLKADGRPLPRTMEGYVWSGMTSGGWSKAIWALLFPFSLANVSSWMLPPAPDGVDIAWVLRRCCQALLRIAALLLTMLLIGQLAAVSLDLLAAQCLAPAEHCLTVVPESFRQLPAVRTALGLVPLLIVLFVINQVSTVNWKTTAEPGDERPARPGHQLNNLPGVGRLADPDAPALRALHLAGSLGVIALIAYGGPLGRGHAPMALWILSLVLVGLCLVGALVFGDPTGSRTGWTGHWAKLATARTPRRLLIAAGVVLVGLAIPALPRPAGPLPGTDPTLQSITIALACACVLLGALLVPAALLARRAWAELPRELRPWAGGWMAAPFMALAALLGGGFGAGVGITVRQALGGMPLALPHGYAYLTLLWGIAGALGLLLTIGLVATAVIRRWVLRRSGRGVPPVAGLLHVDRPADTAAAASVWWWASWIRRHAHRVVLGLAAVLTVGAVVSAVPWLSGALPPKWSAPLSAVGVIALAGLAAWLLRQVYAAIRQPDRARQVGGLADLASFWPRESHPIVPPCYALKAVPELAERVNTYLADPSTRVVLAGHSQGSVLVCSAMARLLDSIPAANRERLGLVVAGSPLRWAYSRAFPGVVPHAGLAELFGDLDGRWRSLCRGTDAIGGGLTTWRRQVFNNQLIGIGFHPEGPSGALSPATCGPTGALVLGGDHWLPDPERGPFPGRRWASGVLKHQDYYSDPEWDRAIACASGLESPTSTTTTPTLFRLPGRLAKSS
jgi:hypothetical protein